MKGKALRLFFFPKLCVSFDSCFPVLGVFMKIPSLSLPVLLRTAHVFAAPIYSAIITAR